MTFFWYQLISCEPVRYAWLRHKRAIDDRPPRSPYFEYAAMFTHLSRELLASDGFRTGGWLNLRAGDKERYGDCPT